MIQHVYPINDSEEHIIILYFITSGDIMKGIRKELYCECTCKPRIEKDNDNYIIIHSSFDGREGVELVNEILNK